MVQKQNPVYTKGDRNVFCPYYRSCLDHACNNHWKYWACMDCQHKEKQEEVVDVLLLPVSDDPYYSISPVLYKKEKEFSLY